MYTPTAPGSVYLEPPHALAHIHREGEREDERESTCTKGSSGSERKRGATTEEKVERKREGSRGGRKNVSFYVFRCPSPFIYALRSDKRRGEARYAVLSLSHSVVRPSFTSRRNGGGLPPRHFCFFFFLVPLCPLSNGAAVPL